MKLLFLILCVFIFLVPFSESARSSTNMVVEALSQIVVPDDYPTIQSAIDAASIGSTIYVKNGTYNESLVITKSLNIYGSEGAATIINSSSGGRVVNIRANNVVFARFCIKGKVEESYGHGIYIQQSNSNQLFDNTVLGNKYGIFIWDSSNITLRNNNMANNSFNFGVWGPF